MTTLKDLEKLKRSYRDLEKAFYTKEFFTMFFDRLHAELVKSYGTDEALRILEKVKNKKLKIINPELFFNTSYAPVELSPKAVGPKCNYREFFRNFLVKWKELKNERVGYFRFVHFFLYLAKIDSFTILHNVLKLNVLEDVIVSLCTCKPEPNFAVFTILDMYLFKFVNKNIQTGTCNDKYTRLIRLFLQAYKRVMQNPNYSHLNLPRIEVIHSILRSNEKFIFFYLQQAFRISTIHLRNLFKRVKDVNDPEVKTKALISLLKSMEGYNYHVDEEKILSKVKESIEKSPYHISKDRLPALEEIGYQTVELPVDSLEHTYMALDACGCLFSPALSEIEVDCKGYKSFEEIEELITMAAKISLVKYRLLNPENRKLCQYKMKITLTNLEFYTPTLMSQLLKRRDELNSYYSKHFVMSAEFSTNFAEGKMEIPKEEDPKYVRVISDIHCDVNRGRGYEFNFDSDFVINCGDTAGSWVDADQWISTFINKGVFVVGNHMGYSYPYPELGILHPKNSRNKQIQLLGAAYAHDDNVTILTSRREPLKKFGNVFFIGATLNSNFELYGEDSAKECEALAGNCINDFKRCYKAHIAQRVLPYTTTDHLYTFKTDFKFLKMHLSRLHKSSQVVVVTHYAPLPYSIADEYKGDLLNAYFTNDLTALFDRFPNIRLWCHGHTHAKLDYIYRRLDKKGNWAETRVVCNPFGYYNENNADLPDNYGTRIRVYHLQIKKPWTSILKEEIEKGEVKVYTKGDRW